MAKGSLSRATAPYVLWNLNRIQKKSFGAAPHAEITFTRPASINGLLPRALRESVASIGAYFPVYT